MPGAPIIMVALPVTTNSGTKNAAGPGLCGGARPFLPWAASMWADSAGHDRVHVPRSQRRDTAMAQIRIK
jgi:hypothetical protein